MIIAFYGFQEAPDVLVVMPATGWAGWFEEWAQPLIKNGHLDHHLHNPFGLYKIAGRLKPNGKPRLMHIDQFELARRAGYHWLADIEEFARAVEQVHRMGGMVRAYLGSPLAIQKTPEPGYIPRSSPGSSWLSFWLHIWKLFGLCNGRSFSTPFGKIRLLPGCLCWDKLVKFHIKPLVDARIDAIGFDASADFYPGDCMDRLVRHLLDRGIEVMIEPWPRKDRRYPPVNWITRECLYHRIRLEPKADEAPPESISGTIYRIVPADNSDKGQAELAFINKIRADHGETTSFSNTQDIINSVRADGHIPLVRAHQLISGSVT